MKVQVSDTIKKAVDEIVSRQNYKLPPEICIKLGSQAGDGYDSITYAISIQPKEGDSIELFVKACSDNIDDKLKDTFVELFKVEHKFYDKIYPALKRFENKRGIKQPFNNVPKYFQTDLKEIEIPPIILQNLKSSGYTLRDRKKVVDNDHLTLSIKTFANYHAIFYAIKDQDPELFQELADGTKDPFKEIMIKFSTQDDMITKCVNQLIESLDPVSDKQIYQHCNNLSEVLINHTMNVEEMADEYSVIGQGDCWNNNMMFLYDNATGRPIDVKLIDWQMQRVNSPLLDFSYFFYTLATKEILAKEDYYLNLYYNTLSQKIMDLGSDPLKTYPYNAFLDHWKKFALFGLTMAFSIVKVMMFEDDEIPDMINDTDAGKKGISRVLKQQNLYLKRMKDLVSHFIEKRLL